MGHGRELTGALQIQLAGDGGDFYQFSDYLAMLSRQSRACPSAACGQIRNKTLQSMPFVPPGSRHDGSRLRR